MYAQLKPDNYNPIDFIFDGIAVHDSGYFFQVGTLDLKEDERIEIIYSETQFGGNAITEKLKLTPIQFEVIVFGRTRTDVINLAQALAIDINAGGYFIYRPDGVSEGNETYYKYERSKPPRLEKSNINHWDNYQEIGDTKYILQLEIEIMSHAIATSDPDNPTQVFPSAGSYIFDSTMIKGDLPAKAKMIITNNSGYNLSRFYFFSRSIGENLLLNLTTDYASWSDSEFTGGGGGGQ